MALVVSSSTQKGLDVAPRKQIRKELGHPLSPPSTAPPAVPVRDPQMRVTPQDIQAVRQMLAYQQQQRRMGIAPVPPVPSQGISPSTYTPPSSIPPGGAPLPPPRTVNQGLGHPLTPPFTAPSGGSTLPLPPPSSVPSQGISPPTYTPPFTAPSGGFTLPLPPPRTVNQGLGHPLTPPPPRTVNQGLGHPLNPPSTAPPGYKWVLVKE